MIVLHLFIGTTSVHCTSFFLFQDEEEVQTKCTSGCQRQRGRVNENPTVTEFCKNTEKLRVINSVCLDSVKGNCRGKKCTEPLNMEKENRPLPQRKYTMSSSSK